ncbi:MAG: hypothetical protein HUU10_13000 [Bacteroidetes bacterium]|nr:hypothetical protein [Bacteroidota bacterium]
MNATLIQKINRVVDELIADIVMEPHRYLQEIDVQIELAHRLKCRIDETRQTIEIMHSNYGRKIKVSRLLAETYVKNNYHPDLILLSEDQSESDLNTGTFRADWVCEVKYKNSFKEIDVDFEKLASILSITEMNETIGTQMYLAEQSTETPSELEKVLRARHPKTEKRIICFFHSLRIG